MMKNLKSPPGRNLATRLVLLAAAILLAQVAVHVSGAKQSKTSLQSQGDGSSPANFYSIKDGKTSARRISQPAELASAGAQSRQQPASATDNWRQSVTTMSAPAQPAADLSTERSAANGDEPQSVSSQAPITQNNNDEQAANQQQPEQQRQRSQQQQDNEPSGGSSTVASGATLDDRSGAPVEADSEQAGAGAGGRQQENEQQQIMISSFNQLVGQSALEDFIGSSGAPTNLVGDKGVSEATPQSAAADQLQQQQRQSDSFSTAMPALTSSAATAQQQTNVAGDSNGNFRQGEFVAPNGQQAAANFNTQAPKFVMQPLSLAAGGNGQTGQAQAQFTTSTGAPVSSPNSISMSLDGMIVNSRPRGETSSPAPPSKSAQVDSGEKRAKQSTKSTTSGDAQQAAPTSGPVSRLGELATRPSMETNNGRAFMGASSGAPLEGGQGNGAKASRRVPFSGTAFSSPATKGQRTKPKAGNQQADGQSGNGARNGQFTGATDQFTGLVNAPAGLQVDAMNGANQRVMMSANKQQQQALRQPLAQQQQAPQQGQGAMRQMRQMLNEMALMQQQQQQQEQQQFEAQLMQQGFDEDQQQMRVNVNDNSLDSNTLEMMKNLLGNTGQQQPDSASSSASSGTGPGDMVMSVMSSPDGKDRRLVMIARETLDSLQRFAQQSEASTGPQRQVQVVTGTKSKSVGQKQRARNQQDSTLGSTGAPNNWWPNGGQQEQQPQTNWQLSSGSFSRQNSQPVTTLSPTLAREMQQQRLDEMNLQTTTTSAPFSSSQAAITTTQQPSMSSTQSNLNVREGGGGSQASAGDASAGVNNTTATAKAATSDTFREVPVSSTSSGSDSQQQPQAQRATSANGRQQVALSSSGAAKSKTNSTKSGDAGGGQQQQPQRSSKLSQQAARQSNGATGAAASSSSSATSQSAGVKGKKKSGANGSSGKQGNGGNGKTANGAKSKTTNGKPSSSQNGQSQGASVKKAQQQQQASGTVRTNGQQQPAAVMMSRAFEQSQREFSAAGSGRRANVSAASDTVGADSPGTTTSASISTSTGAGVTTTTTTSTPSSSTAAGVQSAMGANELEAQVGVQQQQAQQEPQPGITGALALMTPRRSQAAAGTSAPGSEEGGQQQQVRTKEPSSFGAQNRPISRIVPAMSNKDQQQDKQRAGSSTDGEFGGRRPGSSASWQAQPEAAPQNEAERLDALRAAIPGEPLADYPIYSAPPKTSFDCMSQSCPGGYYADLESQCQVFHICQNDGRFDTFLCPNGTIFSQQHFVCVWWWQVDCQQSAAFYKLNDGIYCNTMFPAPERGSSSSGAAASGASLASGQRSSNGTLGSIGAGQTMPNSFDGSGNELSNEPAGLGAEMVALSNVSSEGANMASAPSSTSSSSPLSQTGGAQLPLGSNQGSLSDATAAMFSGSSDAGSGSRQQQSGKDNNNNADTNTNNDADDQQLQQQQLERLARKA